MRIIIAIALAFLMALCFFLGKVSAEDIDWDRLVECVIEVESGGNPNAVSKAGAIGLMQITPIVLKEYNENRKDRSVFYNIDKCQLGDPEMNKIIGTWYLHRLHDHYKCETIEDILWAYNGGIGNKRKGIKYNETKNYIKKVMKLYEKQSDNLKED